LRSARKCRPYEKEMPGKPLTEGKYHKRLESRERGESVQEGGIDAPEKTWGRIAGRHRAGVKTRPPSIHPDWGLGRGKGWGEVNGSGRESGEGVKKVNRERLAEEMGTPGCDATKLVTPGGDSPSKCVKKRALRDLRRELVATKRQTSKGS